PGFGKTHFPPDTTGQLQRRSCRLLLSSVSYGWSLIIFLRCLPTGVLPVLSGDPQNPVYLVQRNGYFQKFIRVASPFHIPDCFSSIGIAAIAVPGDFRCRNPFIGGRKIPFG